MKRKFYPYSRFDRILFWMLIILLLSDISLFIFFIRVIGLKSLTNFDISNFLIVAIGTIISLALLYVFQDIPTQSESNEYTIVISDIKNMGNSLTNLNKFLKREQKRVADTEATIIQLQQQKTELEPIILSQKQTVEAILSAYAKRTTAHIWKERILSFILGIITSLIATVSYNYFIH